MLHALKYPWKKGILSPPTVDVCPIHTPPFGAMGVAVEAVSVGVCVPSI
jgi:hypothetical protein